MTTTGTTASPARRRARTASLLLHHRQTGASQSPPSPYKPLGFLLFPFSLPASSVLSTRESSETQERGHIHGRSGGGHSVTVGLPLCHGTRCRWAIEEPSASAAAPAQFGPSRSLLRRSLWAPVLPSRRGNRPLIGGMLRGLLPPGPGPRDHGRDLLSELRQGVVVEGLDVRV